MATHLVKLVPRNDCSVSEAEARITNFTSPDTSFGSFIKIT